MQRVLKWAVPLNDGGSQQEFGGHILPQAEAIMNGHPHIVIWTVEDDIVPTKLRTLRAFGTGHEVPPGWVWRASSPRLAGMCWHIFELGAP